MIDTNYVNMYTLCAWLILEGSASSERASSYSVYLADLINTCQFSRQNLIISLYYLHKYSRNHINLTDKESNMSIYLVLTSLILANKTFDDQSYTLKTWTNICNGISKSTKCTTSVTINFKLLKDLEMHFLCCLNYGLSYIKIGSDEMFWSQMNKLGASWFNTVKSSICGDVQKSSSYPSISLSSPLMVEPLHKKQKSIVSTPICTNIPTSMPYFMTPQSISSIATPATSMLSISPIPNAQLNHGFLSPLTPITPPYKEFNHKRRRYTYSKGYPSIPHSIQHALIPTATIPTSIPTSMPGLLPPYVAQFNFTHCGF